MRKTLDTTPPGIVHPDGVPVSVFTHCQIPPKSVVASTNIPQRRGNTPVFPETASIAGLAVWKSVSLHSRKPPALRAGCDCPAHKSARAFSCLVPSSLKYRPKGRQVAQIGLSTRPQNSGPKPPLDLREGQGPCPSRHQGTKRPTGGHAGLSCSRRRLATRWCSAASSSSASCCW